MVDRLQARNLFSNRAPDVLTNPEVYSFVDLQQNAGAIMVIDPEEAGRCVDDLSDTCTKAEHFAMSGGKVIWCGGSTDNGEAQIVLPALRAAVDRAGSNTKIFAFPGSESQVALGADATLWLHMPQLYPVLELRPDLEKYFCSQFVAIAEKSRGLNIPVIPVNYILFNAGKPTTVERVTGITAFQVSEGIDEDAIMKELAPWCSPGMPFILELGSGPDKHVNLAPVGKRIYEATGVMPVITGGIKTAEIIRGITEELPFPTVFGTVAEKAKPEEFPTIYGSFRAAHPLTGRQSVAKQ